MALNNFNNNSNLNGNNNLNNDSSFLRITRAGKFFPMNELYSRICSVENLALAFQKARKHKTTKLDVMEFESDLANNLSLLRTELLLHSYKPKTLATFVIHDPKTRKISKSAFRDRVVHHALCNIIEPLFEKSFIYDSYANRIGKGTLKAIHRLEYFSRKVTRNYTQRAYALKADIYHYFDQVNQGLLLSIIQRKIKCPETIWLIKRILANYSTAELRGMPLGNLTSQFFANIYLNELDMFVKYRLGVKYYLRYVDDFVILHESKEMLEKYQLEMQQFLQSKLALQLHPQKTRVIPISSGISFLGMRIFFHHWLLQRKNILSFERKWNTLQRNYSLNETSYDNLYDFLEGWCAYAKQANTFKLRQKILFEFENYFPGEVSTKEVDRYTKVITKLSCTVIPIPSSPFPQ